MLEIDLLGPIAIRSSTGEDLTPASPRERAALAVLAIASPTAVSTERLAYELYGDEVSGDPRNAVQAVISRLRKALGRSAGVLETHAAGYRLVDIRLDIDAAEAEIADAGAESGAVRHGRFVSALSRWRGPSLADLPPSEGLDAERFRVDELRAAAEDAVFEYRLGQQDDPALVAELEAAIRDQPTREGRWALLMRALYKEERQADALRAFQRARQLLAEQLGLEPGPMLTKLEQQILNHDPDLDTALGDRPTPAPQAHLPSGTISVLLCDVEGSVRQWEAAPEVTASRISELHDMWSSAVNDHGGSLIKSTGDGIMAVFHTATDAIEAAVSGQQTHHSGDGLSVRVGINTGPATPVEGDYRGPVVNRCARLLELAAGGQILISGTTALLARDGLDASVTVRNLGSHWLRDVPEPVEISQVTGPGLRSNFPDIRSHGPVGLPRLRTQILGRDELRSHLVDQAGEAPLITLLGPGGIGKTTLALAAGWEMSGTRHVVFVDLAATNDASSVARRIVNAVSHSDDDRQPAERLADRLRTNTDLVIVDNAEHVLDAVADLLDQVLSQELKGSFIVTSRHPLALAGEQIVDVPPLLLPGEDADLVATAATPAVALFLDRLQQARPNHTLADGLLPVVAHICRRLDGIPLAIELAAGRASVLAVEDIAARLDDQLRLLRQVPATRERRHRSLQAVVAWSLDQLDPDTRRLFGLLSVFAGDFGLGSVEAVMGHFGLDQTDSMDQLAELSSSSLLSVERGSRYRMLEPIRQYAASELHSAGVTRSAEWAHARWLADVLSHAHRQDGPQRSREFQEIDLEADELRCAIARIAANGFTDLIDDLAFPAGWWFVTRDPVRGADLMGRILEEAGLDDDSLTYALAVMGWGTAAASHPAVPRLDVIDRSLTILDEHQHPDRGLARIVAGFGYVQAGKIEPAMQQLDAAEKLISSDEQWAHAILGMATAAFHSLALMMNLPTAHGLEGAMHRGEQAAGSFRRLEDSWALGITLGELGRIKQRLGDLEGAEACMLESVDLFDDTEFHGLHYILTELGKLASLRDEHDAAAEYHRQAMEIANSDGGAGCMAMTYGGLACSAELAGDLDQAIDYYEQALALDRASLKPGVPSAWQSDLERLKADRA